MPFYVLSVEGALRASGERYDVVAATLGADRWTTFRRVTLPLAMPGVLAPARCWPGPARSASSAPRSPSPATTPAPPRRCRSLIYQALQADPEVAPDAEHDPAGRLRRRPGRAAQPLADDAVSAPSTPRREPGLVAGLRGRRVASTRASRRRRRGRRGDRPQRRRQDHAAARARRAGRRRRRPVTVAGESWTAPPRAGPRARTSGCVFQDQVALPAPDAARQRRLRAARPAGSRGARPTPTARQWLDRFGIGDLAGAPPPRALRRPGPAGRDRPGAGPRAPPCCCSTSRSPGSTSASRPRCGSSSPATSRRTTASRCWSPTTPSTRSPWPTGCWSSTTGRVAQTGTPARRRRPAAHRPRGPAGRPQRDPRGRRAPLAFSPQRGHGLPASPQGSARHRWHGPVLERRPARGRRPPRWSAAGQELIADVTPAATAELGLAPGREVWLSVKETAVETYARSPPLTVTIAHVRCRPPPRRRPRVARPQPRPRAGPRHRGGRDGRRPLGRAAATRTAPTASRSTRCA